jgi:zona occludens toxin
MAIDAYVGLPGSGKSYSVVKFAILPSLKQGRQVITNIPLTDVAHNEFPDLIRQLPHDWYQDETLFESIPNGSVVVLDELWRRWPKGMPAAKVPFRDKEFLAEHRHLVDEEGNSTRIVLVTQDLDQISSFATMLVDTTYQSVKMSALGSSKRFRVDIYQGAAKGQRPPKSRLLRSVFDRYEKTIHQYYQSATKSLTGLVGDESKADRRATIWKSPLMLFTLASPIILGLLVWQIGKFFSNGMTFTPPEPEPVAKVQPLGMVNEMPADLMQSAASSDPLPVQQPSISISTVWRVAGHMQRVSADSGKMADLVLLTSVYGLRYEPMHNCEPVSMGTGYQCHIDGSLATPWSGPLHADMSASVLGGASQTVNAAGQAVGIAGERSESGKPRQTASAEPI